MTLTESQRSTLISQSLTARTQSYSPYSHFRVGACLLTQDGTFISGSNVECASYGGAICAERTAVVKGVSEGHQKFLALAVSSDVEGPTSPCGICRQVLREFCALDMPIYLIPSNFSSTTKFLSLSESLEKSAKDFVVVTTMGEMLPLSFGPEDLETPRVPN